MTPLNRRGMALPLALFTVVIAAALITAVFYFGRLEQRLGDNAISANQSFEAAEAGVSAVLAAWNIPVYNNMANGAVDTITPTPVSMGGGASYNAYLRRLTPNDYLLRTEGWLTRGGKVTTRQQVVRLLRLNTPDINMNAAITTRTGMTVSGSSQISGTDSVPTGWGATCPPAGPSVPGIRDSSGNVSTSGACSGASCITGSPRIQTDPTVNSTSFSQFGELTFADLAAMANATIAPNATVTGPGPVVNAGPPVSCATSNSLNWGDPYNPLGACFNYFPIIYAQGDVHISGGYGQGILLVNGDLTISSGFEFYGPVIVQGQVQSTGTGGHIIGGVLANDGSFTISSFSGNSVVGYSSCALARALRGSANAKPLKERSWAQVY